MQVLCADQRRPSKTFKNTIRAELFSRSHGNKTPRSFVQVLWVKMLAYLNMMLHLLSLHGKKRTHGLYHSPVFDLLFRCLIVLLAVICDLIPSLIICYIFLNLAHMGLIMVCIAFRVCKNFYSNHNFHWELAEFFLFQVNFMRPQKHDNI